MARWCWFVAVCLLAVSVWAGSKRLFDEVLETGEHWEQTRALRERQAPLNLAQVEALREFVTRQEGKDWVLYRLGQRLLRANVADAPQPAAEVVQAEEILLGIVKRKAAEEEAARIEELARLGPVIAPLLQEVIVFEGAGSRIRKLTAVRVLRRLGDPRLAPFVRERARREPDLHP